MTTFVQWAEDVLDRFRFWLLRAMFKAITHDIDYSMQPGDVVISKHWSLTPLIVVNVNWAMRSVAVQLGERGGVVVWPVWSVRKAK